jgi:antitoxin VapB
MKTKIIVVRNNGGKIIIPEEFMMNDDKVYMKKVGNSIYIIPFSDPWQNLIESTEDFSSDFMSSRNQLEQQKRDF